jgi:hypothetical protein
MKWRVILDARLEIGESSMPSEWIKIKAEQERKAEDDSRTRHETEKRETELIRALGLEFIMDLRKVLDEG